MSSSKMTIVGFYNYMNANDNDLFMNLSLPDGIDKETVVNNILLRGGEFEVLYSNPYFMRDSIVTWSKKWYWTFDKWIKAINIEYNPLENFNRNEEWEEKTDNINDFTSTDSIDKTISTAESATTDTTINDSTTVNSTSEDTKAVSAYDAETWTNKEKVNNTTGTNSSGNNVTNVNTSGNITTSDDTENNTVSKDVLDGKIKHTGHLYGNIGVTTSQQMLESELEIAKFNLYDRITDIFLSEYIIPIYS